MVAAHPIAHFVVIVVCIRLWVLPIQREDGENDHIHLVPVPNGCRLVSEALGLPSGEKICFIDHQGKRCTGNHRQSARQQDQKKKQGNPSFHPNPLLYRSWNRRPARVAAAVTPPQTAPNQAQLRLLEMGSSPTSLPV